MLNGGNCMVKVKVEKSVGSVEGDQCGFDVVVLWEVGIRLIGGQDGVWFCELYFGEVLL